jgi:hypothetical protein
MDAKPSALLPVTKSGAVRPSCRDKPEGGGSVVRARVVAYDELPMSPDNAKLLSITAQHPDVRVQTRTAPSK